MTTTNVRFCIARGFDGEVAGLCLRLYIRTLYPVFICVPSVLHTRSLLSLCMVLRFRADAAGKPARGRSDASPVPAGNSDGTHTTSRNAQTIFLSAFLQYLRRLHSVPYLRDTFLLSLSQRGALYLHVTVPTRQHSASSAQAANIKISASSAEGLRRRRAARTRLEKTAIQKIEGDCSYQEQRDR